jgi:hypothetical protein
MEHEHTSQLLKTLNSTSNQQPPLGLHIIILKQVLPRPNIQRCLVSDGLYDLPMQPLNYNVPLIAFQPFEHGETFIRSIVCREPTGRFWDDIDDEEHWDEKDTLKDNWDAPCGRAGMGAEGIIDPIHEEDAEI